MSNSDSGTPSAAATPWRYRNNASITRQCSTSVQLVPTCPASPKPPKRTPRARSRSCARRNRASSGPASIRHVAAPSSTDGTSTRTPNLSRFENGSATRTSNAGAYPPPGTPTDASLSSSLSSWTTTAVGRSLATDARSAASRIGCVARMRSPLTAAARSNASSPPVAASNPMPRSRRWPTTTDRQLALIAKNGSTSGRQRRQSATCSVSARRSSSSSGVHACVDSRARRAAAANRSNDPTAAAASDAVTRRPSVLPP